MSPSDRVLLGGLVATTMLIGLRRESPHPSSSVSGAPQDSPVIGSLAVPVRLSSRPSRATDDPQLELGQELEFFVERLGALRSGEATAEAELERSAERLCRNFERCDARDVASFYLDLTPDERRRGLADYQIYLGLWKRIRLAGREDLRGKAWRELRAEVLEELREFAAVVMTRADFVPAGRALSLAARLEVEYVERSEELDGRAVAAVLERASDCARRSRAIFERAGQLTPQLEPLWLLGRIERHCKRVNQAHVWFESCLEVAVRVGNKTFREHALQGLVALARDAGDSDGMDALLAEISTFRSPAESWLLAREHGARLLHQDHPREALDFLLRYAPLEPTHRNEWHLLTGSAFLRAGDPVSAREQFAQLSDRHARESSLLASGSYDLAQGNYEEVVDRLDRPGALEGLTDQGRAQAMALLGEALLRMDRPAQAIQPLEEAVDIADAWRERQLEARDLDTLNGSVIGEWLGLHTVVLLAQAWARIERGIEAARTIEDFQSRTLRAAEGEAPRVVTRRTLKRWAKSFDLGLITWAIGPDSAVVAHVAPDGSAFALPLEDGRRSIVQAVRRLREAAIAENDDLAAELARELKDRVLPPELRARWAQSGGEQPRLLLLLHGPLEELPFEFLELTTAGGQEIVPLALPGLLGGGPGEALQPEALDRWLLFGSPLESSAAANLPYLPGARAELEEIAALRPSAELALGGDFDREGFEGALMSGAAIHVATHLTRECGCRSARLADVGLALGAGEIFCAHEVRRRAGPLPLVVLAACETAGGRFVDAEGLHGLARAFLESGTRNLLVSLWPVEDEAAQRFALAFHRALSDGEAPSRAAHRARRSLQAAGYGSADWAAFRLLGRD